MNPADETRHNPYIGPRAFKAGETIYGRDRELRDLLNYFLSQRIVLLHSPSGAGKTSLIFAGLVPNLEAKGFRILPVARVNQEKPPDLQIAGENPPASKLNRYTFSALISLDEELPEEQQTSGAELALLSLDEYLSRRPHPALPEGADQPDVEVLIFDQFEEILTIEPADLDGKVQFFNQLGDALRQRNRWVLFSMREDYIAALDPYLKQVPTHLSNRFRLDLLGVDAAREAIQKPAQREKVEFSQQAAQRLVDDLRRVQVQRPDGVMEEQLGPYVEPVQLQVVCYRLWQGLAGSQARIDVEDISKTGDVDQSLGEYYAEQVASISAATGVSERHIRAWFERKLVTEQGVRGQVLRGPERSEGLENQAIELGEHAHLVRSEKRRGAIWYELAHDRLVEPVRRDNAAWFLNHLSLLQRTAELWENESRSKHLLMRGQALEDGIRWAEEHREEVTKSESDFLAASIEVRQQEIDARLAEERNARILRQRYILASIAAIVALFFAAYSFILRGQAQESSNRNATLAAENLSLATAGANDRLAAETAQAQAIYIRATAEAARQGEASSAATAQAAQAEAILQSHIVATAVVRSQDLVNQAQESLSNQLAAQGLELFNSNPTLSTLLGVEAYKAFDTPAASNLLLRSIERSQESKVSVLDVIPDAQRIFSLAISPDGDTFAFGVENGIVVLRSASRGLIEVFPRVHNAPVTALAFSRAPAGVFLASGDADGYVFIRNLETRDTYFFRNPAAIKTLAFHPQNNWLAVDAYQRVAVLDIDKIWKSTAVPLPQVRTFTPHIGNVTAIAWSPDGRYLSVGDDQKNIYVWETDQEGKPIVGPVKAHLGAVTSLDWSPDGKWFASTAINDYEDTQVIVWAFTGSAAGEIVAKFKNSERGVDTSSLSFSPDGQILAVGDDLGQITLWNTNTWSQIDIQALEYGGTASVENNDIIEVKFLPAPGKNTLLAAQKGKQLGVYEVTLKQGLVTNLAQNLGGEVLAISGLGNDQIRVVLRSETGIDVLDLTSSSTQPVLSFPENPSRRTALSQDGKLLALENEDATGVDLYEISSGAVIPSLIPANPNPPLWGVESLAFNDRSTLLAIARCYYRYYWACIGSDYPLPILAILDEGHQISAYADWMDAWYDSRYESRRDDAALFKVGPSVLSFSPDNDTLVMGSNLAGGNEISFWDIAKEDLINSFTVPYEIHAMRVKPDGSLLALGLSDARIWLWSLPSQTQVGPPLTGATSLPTSMAFDSTGERLYLGLQDGTVQVWEMNPNIWMQLACGIAGRDMTQVEWAQYFPNQAYQSSCGYQQ